MTVTSADIEKLWISLVGTDYARPLLADTNSGAVLRAVFAMYARMVESLNITSSAKYRLTWPTQSAEPADDDAKATVNLTVTRTSAAAPMYFGAGFYTEEEVYDVPDGSQGDKFGTGRKYFVRTLHALAPGELTGTLAAEAEFPGYGYNNPVPDTITRAREDFVTSGADAVIKPIGSDFVLEAALTDRPVSPDYVGSTLRITGGTYSGEYALVTGFSPGTTTHNGQLVLAQPYILTGLTVSGSFIDGEHVTQGSSIGILARHAGDYFIVFPERGTFVATVPILGHESGAAVAATTVQAPAFTGTVTGVPWSMVTPVTDGLTVTNPTSPAGGRLGLLDSIGLERGIPRAQNETADQYRTRLGVPQGVTPEGIKRLLAQVLTPLGLSATLREPPGTTSLPGLFLDKDALDYPDDGTHNYQFLFDADRARAFFIVTLPRMSDGLAAGIYDYEGAYSTAGSRPFVYDGYALTAAKRRKTLHDRLTAAKAQGVTFEFDQPRASLDTPLHAFRGCMLHVSTDVGITKDGGNNVTEWADQSSYENHLVPGAAPLWVASDSKANDAPTVDFAGGKYLQTTWDMPLGPYTVVLVCTGPADAGYAYTHATNANLMYGGTTTTLRSLRAGAGTDHQKDFGSAWGARYALTYTTFVVREAASEATTFTLTANDQLVPLATTVGGILGTSLVTGKFVLGANSIGGSPANFRVVEMAVYNRAINGDEEREINQILRRKYGHWPDPARQPTQVPGLILWLDGSDRATMEFAAPGVVNRWRNKVLGYSSDFTQSAAASGPAYTEADPAYNYRGVLSSTGGAADHLLGSMDIPITGGGYANPYTAAVGYTVFIVGDRAAGTAYLLAGASTEAQRFQLKSTGASWELYAGTAGNTATGADVPNVVCGVIVTGNDDLYISSLVTAAASGASGTASFPAANNPALGIFATGDAVSKGPGKVAEILVYRRVLTATERKAIGRYLARRYALPAF